MLKEVENIADFYGTCDTSGSSASTDSPFRSYFRLFIPAKHSLRTLAAHGKVCHAWLPVCYAPHTQADRAFSSNRQIIRTLGALQLLHELNKEDIMFFNQKLIISAISVIILCTVFIFSEADAEPFRVGYFELIPHAFPMNDINKSNEKSLAIEYFKLIGMEVGLSDVTFRQYPLARLLYLLEKGQLDAALLLAKNPERQSKFIYPKNPFFLMRPAIVLKKSHPLQEIKSVQDLLPLKIGVRKAGWYSHMINDKRLSLEPLSGENVILRQFKKLMSNRLDAFYSPDSVSLRYVGEKHDFSDKTKILFIPEEATALYTVFSRESGKKYSATYEKALIQVQNHQTYEQFLNDHIKE